MNQMFNKESGYIGYTNQGHRRGRTRLAIKRADAEAILIKGDAEGGERRATTKRADTESVQDREDFIGLRVQRSPRCMFLILRVN